MGILGEPGRHKTTHQDDGSDEISVEALSGLLADDQHVLDTEVLAVAIAKTLLTTKGDLMAYSTVLARLGIGTDTHVLTADSGEDTGMKWAAAAADGNGATLTVAETEVFNDTSPTSWTDLDLSGTIGSQATLVVLKHVSIFSVGEAMAFRKNGDTDEFYSPGIPDRSSFGVATLNQIGNVHGVVLVVTDATGKIEWRVEEAHACTIDIIAYIK